MTPSLKQFCTNGIQFSYSRSKYFSVLIVIVLPFAYFKFFEEIRRFEASGIPLLAVGENWELGTNQSVICRATTLIH